MQRIWVSKTAEYLIHVAWTIMQACIGIFTEGEKAKNKKKRKEIVQMKK